MTSRATSLRTKIVVFNAFVLALALLATAVAVAGFWRAFAPLRQAVTEESQAVDLADALRVDLGQEELTVAQVVAGGASADAFREADARFEARIAQVEATVRDEQARAALAAAHVAETELNRRAVDALAARSASDDPAAALRVLVGSVLPAREAADAALGRFLAQQEMAARAAEREAARAALATLAAYAACLAVAGAAGAALSLRFSRHMLERVEALMAATGRLAAGDRAVRLAVPPEGGDELDVLGREFNRTVEHLAEAEAAARRVDELQRSFLASVSHDLRTPLTVVAGLLETLLREDAAVDAATSRDLLDVAAQESRRLTRLVTNLLDLSRLEAGSWPLDREAVDLAAFARARVEDLSLPGGPLEDWRVQVTGGGPDAWVDAVQIGRVLDNLLTNAAKYSPPGATIRVAVAVGRGAPGGGPPAPLTVRVQDDGPGIPEAEHDRIFDKFYRAGNGAGGNGAAGPDPGGPAPAAVPGTGLGLAICRGIVEAHGGRIWVDSQEGRGACFAFTVPAAVVARQVAA